MVPLSHARLVRWPSPPLKRLCRLNFAINDTNRCWGELSRKEDAFGTCLDKLQSDITIASKEKAAAAEYARLIEAIVRGGKAGLSPSVAMQAATSSAEWEDALRRARHERESVVQKQSRAALGESRHAEAESGHGLSSMQPTIPASPGVAEPVPVLEPKPAQSPSSAAVVTASATRASAAAADNGADQSISAPPLVSAASTEKAALVGGALLAASGAATGGASACEAASVDDETIAAMASTIPVSAPLAGSSTGTGTLAAAAMPPLAVQTAASPTMPAAAVDTSGARLDTEEAAEEGESAVAPVVSQPGAAVAGTPTSHLAARTSRQMSPSAGELTTMPSVPEETIGVTTSEVGGVTNVIGAPVPPISTSMGGSGSGASYSSGGADAAKSIVDAASAPGFTESSTIVGMPLHRSSSKTSGALDDSVIPAAAVYALTPSDEAPGASPAILSPIQQQVSSAQVAVAEANEDLGHSAMPDAHSGSVVALGAPQSSAAHDHAFVAAAGATAAGAALIGAAGVLAAQSSRTAASAAPGDLQQTRQQQALESVSVTDVDGTTAPLIPTAGGMAMVMNVPIMPLPASASDAASAELVSGVETGSGLSSTVTAGQSAAFGGGNGASGRKSTALAEVGGAHATHPDVSDRAIGSAAASAATTSASDETGRVYDVSEHDAGGSSSREEGAQAGPALANGGAISPQLRLMDSPPLDTSGAPGATVATAIATSSTAGVVVAKSPPIDAAAPLSSAAGANLPAPTATAADDAEGTGRESGVSGPLASAVAVGTAVTVRVAAAGATGGTAASIDRDREGAQAQVLEQQQQQPGPTGSSVPEGEGALPQAGAGKLNMGPESAAAPPGAPQSQAPPLPLPGTASSAPSAARAPAPVPSMGAGSGTGYSLPLVTGAAAPATAQQSPAPAAGPMEACFKCQCSVM